MPLTDFKIQVSSTRRWGYPTSSDTKEDATTARLRMAWARRPSSPSEWTCTVSRSIGKVLPHFLFTSYILLQRCDQLFVKSSSKQFFKAASAAVGSVCGEKTCGCSQWSWEGLLAHGGIFKLYRNTLVRKMKLRCSSACLGIRGSFVCTVLWVKVWCVGQPLTSGTAGCACPQVIGEHVQMVFALLP